MKAMLFRLSISFNFFLFLLVPKENGLEGTSLFVSSDQSVSMVIGPNMKIFMCFRILKTTDGPKKS